MAKNSLSVGGIAYMVGFFGAIFVGLLSAFGAFEMGVVISTILILAGIFIGLMNISQKEKTPMMVASLVIGGGAGVLSSLAFVGEYLSAILGALAMVVLPAGIVVAFVVVMNKAK